MLVPEIRPYSTFFLPSPTNNMHGFYIYIQAHCLNTNLQKRNDFLLARDIEAANTSFSYELRVSYKLSHQLWQHWIQSQQLWQHWNFYFLQGNKVGNL
jgi:hypothetical protein